VINIFFSDIILIIYHYFVPLVSRNCIAHCHNNIRINIHHLWLAGETTKNHGYATLICANGVFDDKCHPFHHIQPYQSAFARLLNGVLSICRWMKRVVDNNIIIYIQPSTHRINYRGVWEVKICNIYLIYFILRVHTD